MLRISHTIKTGNKQQLLQRAWDTRQRHDSPQMRVPRDNTGLGTVIYSSSEILLDGKYKWKFLESVFLRKGHTRDILALEHLRCPWLQELLKGPTGREKRQCTLPRNVTRGSQNRGRGDMPVYAHVARRGHEHEW